MPVRLRIRFARRRRILDGEVSGSAKKRRIQMGPESQSISQANQRQPSTGMEKPEMTGPRAGPQVAEKAQSVRT